MQIGYIGLGRMGKNMVLRLLEQGIEVVAFNRSLEPISNISKAFLLQKQNVKYQISNIENAEKKFTAAKSIEELVEELPKQRIIWLMLPAGNVTDEYIHKLFPLLSEGDLIIDGANSFYKDSLRRAEKAKEKGIHFMDIGVSGGPKGAREGACLMIGGSEEDFKSIVQLVKAAAAPGAYQHLGPVGSGHFAKMVHNGIEYGMMESLGEGLAVLKYSQFKYDFAKLLDLYNHNSVIESRLVDCAKKAFEEDSDLSNTSSIIGSGGAGKERIKAEADWTVDVAKEIGVEVPTMEDSIRVRSQSPQVLENSPNGFRNKVISAMRGKFGSHDVKKK